MLWRKESPPDDLSAKTGSNRGTIVQNHSNYTRRPRRLSPSRGLFFLRRPVSFPRLPQATLHSSRREASVLREALPLLRLPEDVHRPQEVHAPLQAACRFRDRRGPFRRKGERDACGRAHHRTLEEGFSHGASRSLRPFGGSRGSGVRFEGFPVRVAGISIEASAPRVGDAGDVSSR